MEILGYLASVLIGLSLGLIGSGGSILMVPVLVYLFKIDVVIATSYSLFIVGSTSLAGAWTNYTKGFVSIRTAMLFGASSIVTVFVTRRYLLPAIPEIIATAGDQPITKSMLTMVLFALLMLAASIAMIRSSGRGEPAQDQTEGNKIFLLAVYGIGIGLVTGFLGAGGGFLIIPVLVLLLKMPVKQAIGTSLLIIALNSLIGFTGDLGHIEMNWTLLISLTLIAIAGIIAGGYLGRKIPGGRLKKAFGWFVLIMGVYILIREMFL